MLVSEILQIYDLLDRPGKPGKEVAKLFDDSNAKVTITPVTEKAGSTECIKIIISGNSGKTNNGPAKTLGIIGRLGGVGARPETIGLVSDGEGALSALSIALRLVKMQRQGDVYEGDIIVATHICTNAPTTPHEPVPFMGSPIELDTMNKYEVDKDMDAILSIDTSRGNKIINVNGFALSPTVKQGYILKVSNDLLRIMEQTTGAPAVTFPISIPDITPYGNGLYHFNSIMLPAIATSVPVVGIAITSILPVAGCATGITNVQQIDSVGRFVIEVAQQYGKNTCELLDKQEFNLMVKKYGTMTHFQELR